jgi:hypothetical protein
MKMIRSEDIPAEVLRPPNWRQWKVIAYTGKNGDVRRGQTFVLADTEAQACELGKAALRMLGIRGRYVVNAMRYYPWGDPAFFRYYGYAP